MSEKKVPEERQNIKVSSLYGKEEDTGVDVNILKNLGNKISLLPKDFEFHPQIRKIYDARIRALEDKSGIDYGTAEALAFATLMQEGNHIRISG